MSDLIKRSQKALAVDVSLPKWQRLEEMLKAFSGLELSSLDDDVRDEFEGGLVKVNQVLSQYDLKPNDDYRVMSDADLDEALAAASEAATGAIENELVRIVVHLDGERGKLPVAAIEETRQHRELMIPQLIEVLREAAADVQAGYIEGDAHFFGMFLLTEFHSEKGFQAIKDAMSLPSELPFDLFGDSITETLARILAEFCGDFPETLDELIANRQLNEYVRWEAAQTYIYLVRDGRMSRDEAVRRLRHHLRQGLDDRDYDIITKLVCELSRFGAYEALEEIQEAFEQETVELFMIDFETVKKELADGEVTFQKSIERCPPTGIEDTIAELRTWAAFREEEKRKPPPVLRHSSNAGPGAAVLAPSRPAAATEQRVGRNDPCPCGSGKKFKKCCLRGP